MAELPSRQCLRVPSGARTALYMSLIRHHQSGRPDALFRDPFSAAVVAELAGSSELEGLAAGLGATPESALVSARDDVADWLVGYGWAGSYDKGLCGPPRVRSPLPAASCVLAREELFPVWGYGSGWASRSG